MNILIADDSKLSRTILANALLKLGHQVIIAEQGEEAITLFKKERPDLIILDVVMQGMNGFECARKIRELDRQDWIPIIFLSSSIDDENIAEGIDAGGDDYLAKPFSEVTLSAKIRSMQRIADMRTQLIETTKKLNILSSTDPLTGLYNRLKFDQTLTETVAHAQRFNTLFALFIIDLDHFKEINDQYGHHVGDSFLKEVSNRLKNSLRIDDFIARLGGDEFAIILRRINSLKQAEDVANKIISLTIQPYLLENKKIPISFSIGIAINTSQEKTKETLMIEADMAMYNAKMIGGNRYKVFSPELNSSKSN